MALEKKRILITSGGTGGHVFPAQAIADELVDLYPDCEIFFVAGGLKSNRFFQKSSYRYQEVPCGRLVKNPVKFIKHAINIAKGVWKSYQAIRKFSPDVVVGFGSYYTFPTLIAARLASTPIILHEANSFPGKINRLFSPLAHVTALHFTEASFHLKGKVIKTGMPLRKGYKKISLSRKEALNYFGLNESKMTILVLGGSQGAKNVNHLVCEAIKNCNPTFLTDIQVLHFTGNPEATEEAKKAYAACGISACVKDFEPNMDRAWRAVDFSISRAGGSTIAEQMEYEVPGILIPYPHAADNHQFKNAELFAKLGFGIVLEEKDLSATLLQNEMIWFLEENAKQLKQFKHELKLYKINSDHIKLSDLILKFLQK